jgi:hypothetical protein
MIKTAIIFALCLAFAYPAAPSTTGFYTVSKDFGMGFQYLWSVQFETSMQVPFNTTTMDIGYMTFCAQTTGSQSVGPFACRLNYAYDASNDKFHFMTGPCDAALAHQHTDEMIKGMTFDSANDALTMSFTSHGPTGGDFVLTKAASSLITGCPAVTDAAPFVYCPAKSILEMMSVLIN